MQQVPLATALATAWPGLATACLVRVDLHADHWQRRAVVYVRGRKAVVDVNCCVT